MVLQYMLIQEFQRFQGAAVEAASIVVVVGIVASAFAEAVGV